MEQSLRVNPSPLVMMKKKMSDQLEYLIKKYDFINHNFGYVFELGVYISYIFKPKARPKEKFVIFGTGRSGSTLLVSLLNSNSQVFCDNEIYHRKVLFPQLSRKARTRLGNKEVYGFKCLTYQVGKILGYARDDQHLFLRKLTREGYKIIYLERENALRQGLSNLYARYRNQFHSNSTVMTRDLPKQMQVDLKELLDWVEGVQRAAARENQMLEGIPHLKLFYERDLEDPASHPQTLKKLSEYLKVDFEMPDTELQKVTPQKLSDFVANHEEVESFIREKGYGHFLDN
ncbi:MAG: hypothetical protein R3C61_08355 [Bacteroidia bacterium]